MDRLGPKCGRNGVLCSVLSKGSTCYVGFKLETSNNRLVGDCSSTDASVSTRREGLLDCYLCCKFGDARGTTPDGDRYSRCVTARTVM